MKEASRDLQHVVTYISERSDKFLGLSQRFQTPFYAYDQEALDFAVDNFMLSFKSFIGHFEGCYALKLNHHPYILERVVAKGMGIDVASRRELLIALKSGAKRIVFYSPGKNKRDLELALKYSKRVRIHVDSFAELDLLGKLSKNLRQPVEISVRINFPRQGLWKKYGIKLTELKSFWKAAQQYRNIHLNGIHFHQSRNKTSAFYCYAIKTLARYLTKSFSKEELEQVRYIDFGGGFEPYLSEGVIVHKKKMWPTYKVLKTDTLKKYAEDIGNSIRTYLDPLIKATYIAEPGRYICNSAMHIVMSVADLKDEKNCILNGGVNMVGWQRFESEYFPIVNITHKGDIERPMNMWGNLCTTWDIWGYYIYSSELSPGDCVVVPNQGALTYSLAQSFINGIPKVYKL